MANAPAALSSVPAKSDGPILKMTGVSKRFPGVLALEDVHLEVGQAEIHALLGENGAGKSTLLKILSGAHSADAGTIELFGAPVAFATPHDAQRAGVVTIYQEFTLAPDMTIAENVFIGREPGSKLFVNWRKLAADTRAITERIGLERDPMTLVRDLSVAEQQMVEIARALSMRSRLIVMDEPTSALERDGSRQALPHHRRSRPRGCRSSSSPIGWRRCSASATATPCCATAVSSARGESPKPMSTPSSA